MLKLRKANGRNGQTQKYMVIQRRKRDQTERKQQNATVDWSMSIENNTFLWYEIKKGTNKSEITYNKREAQTGGMKVLPQMGRDEIKKREMTAVETIYKLKN